MELCPAARYARGFEVFLRSGGHTLVPFVLARVPPTTPHADITRAGMVAVQLDVFLGNEKRPYNRATSSQKVMRAGGKHNDLENVGPLDTPTTPSLRCMGNFSFGDYLSAKGIALRVGTAHEELRPRPETALWPTIYTWTMTMSYKLWQEVAGVRRAG